MPLWCVASSPRKYSISAKQVLGIFLTLFIFAIYATAVKRRHYPLNKAMLATSFLMLLLTTAQIVVDTTYIFLAFVTRTPSERVAFLFDVSQPIFAVKHSILIIMLLVGDSFVVIICIKKRSRLLLSLNHPDISVLVCVGETDICRNLANLPFPWEYW